MQTRRVGQPNEKPPSQKQDGHSAALAVFIVRPQSSNQIGAEFSILIFNIYSNEIQKQTKISRESN